MSQCAPYTRLLAKTLYISDEVVSKKPELFRLLFIVLVRPHMDSFSSEHRVWPFQIFFKNITHNFICFRVVQVQMVHSVLFTANFWHHSAKSE
ncbi:hypothetical protein D3C87_1314920 [compost metagenome]